MFQLVDHPHYKSIKLASELLDKYLSQNSEAKDVKLLDDQFKYLFWVWEKSDQALISKQEFDQLTSIANSVLQQVQQIPNNPSVQVPNALTQMAALLQRFPRPRKMQFARSEIADHIEELATSKDEKINRLESRIFQLNEQISTAEKNSLGLIDTVETTQKNMTAMEATIGTAVEKTSNELRNQNSSSIEQKVTEFSEIFEQLRTEIQSQISSATTELTKIQLEREQVKKDATTKLDKTLQEKTTQAEVYISKIRNLYGIAGSDTTSGGLIQTAQNEQFSYRIFAGLAVVALLVASISAYLILSPVLTSQLNFQNSFGRIALTAALFLPAGFLTSLASRHRRAEIAFRSLALRVAAFDPYILNLPEDKQNELREKMAEAFFASEMGEMKKTNITRTDLDQLTESFAKISPIFEKIRELVPQNRG